VDECVPWLVVIPRLAAAAGLAPRLGSLLAAGTSICGRACRIMLATSSSIVQTRS
jgi:uncharacterized membrane protein YadS